MSFPLSQHFAIEEMACHSGEPYPIDRIDDEDSSGLPWITTRLMPLIATLEAIRIESGGPLRILSGYRTLDYDQKLYDADKGAGNVATPQGSQHPKGRAADVLSTPLVPKLLHALILDMFHSGKLPHLGGLGKYPTFLHIDVRHRAGSIDGSSDGHLARWEGTRVSNIV